MRKLLTWGGVVLAAMVCVGLSITALTAEPRYKDKPLSEWVRMAHDLDFDTRRQAVVALGHFRGSKVAANELRKVRSSGTVSERAAVLSLYEVTGDATECVAYEREDIHNWAAHFTTDYASEPMADTKEVVSALGADARPLIPDLENAKAKLNNRNDRDGHIRRAYQDLIDSVPK